MTVLVTLVTATIVGIAFIAAAVVLHNGAERARGTGMLDAFVPLALFVVGGVLIVPLLIGLAIVGSTLLIGSEITSAVIGRELD